MSNFAVLGPWIWWNWAWKVSEFDVLEEVFWFVFDMNSFCLSFTGARSWPRGLTCALSMWSTQRAGTVSCSASKRTRLRRWRPSRRAAGWNWSARYEIIQNDFFIKNKWKNFQDVQVKYSFAKEVFSLKGYDPFRFHVITFILSWGFLLFGHLKFPHCCLYSLLLPVTLTLSAPRKTCHSCWSPSPMSSWHKEPNKIKIFVHMLLVTSSSVQTFKLPICWSVMLCCRSVMILLLWLFKMKSNALFLFHRRSESN